MGAREEEIWTDAEPLRWAWRKYADFGLEGFSRADRLQELWGARADETEVQAERRFAEFERLEKNLKSEFLTRIQDGEFHVYGRDVTGNVDADIVRVPAGLFDQDDDSFVIDWDRSRVQVLGKVLIELRAVPVSPHPQPTSLETPGKLADTETPDKQPPKTGGRPNTQRDFKEKAREIIAEDPSFLTTGNRKNQAREIKARLYGEGARKNDNMAGCQIETAIKWLGQVANEQRK